MPKRYYGAGILFFVKGEGGIEILLAQRKSGIWSIPGGGMSRRDGRNSFACAKRETAEEFGANLAVTKSLETEPPRRRRVSFRLFFFNWDTYIVELPCKPSDYPSSTARDYRAEFRAHQWFTLSALPKKRHHLLLPVILLLKSMR
jgi:8-oxo-dGTP pyrophosphatase MutT (NUDIX family)